MLVYYKEPYGVLHVRGYRIYGKWTGRDPVDIPWEVYKEYKKLFVDGTYYVGKVSFRLKELPHISYQTLLHIAHSMNLLKFHGNPTRSEAINLIKKALRNGT